MQTNWTAFDWKMLVLLCRPVKKKSDPVATTNSTKLMTKNSINHSHILVNCKINLHFKFKKKKKNAFVSNEN